MISLIVLDEWVTSDGNLNNSGFSPNLSLSINGNAPASFLIAGFLDNHATTFNQLTPNDGYLFINNEISMSAGDSLTIKAGTYSLSATANFNPQASQIFIGNVFLTNDSGNRISNSVTAVPEPSLSAALIGMSVLAIVLFRQRNVIGRTRRCS